MASKKQKKNKGQTFSLQEFTASLESKSTTTSGQNVVFAPKQAPQKSWADEVDDDDFADMVIANKMKMLLPSAPRASRGPDFNEADIPHVPPFTAHMGNISFDIDESDVYGFFKDLQVTELRLPRDQNNRLRGFGYVQFKTRSDLIEALGMNEQMLNGRPVRINLGQSQGDGGDRRGGGGSRNAPDETPEDWRSAPPTQLTGPARTSDFDRSDFRGGRSENYGSDYGSRGGDFGRRPYGGGSGRYDGQGGSEYGGPRGGDFGGRRGGDYGDRDGSRSFGRDREGNGYRDRRDGPTGGVGSEEEEATTWRRGPVVRGDAHSEQDRSFRNRDRQGDSRDGRYGSHSREMSPDFSDVRSHRPRVQSPEFKRLTQQPYAAPPRDETERDVRKASPPRERKKLVIAPRTVTESSSDSNVGTNSAIFGGARPVDTAAREREIERKLAEQMEQEDQRRGSGIFRPTITTDTLPSSEASKQRPSSPSTHPTQTSVKHKTIQSDPSVAQTLKSDPEDGPLPAPPTNAWAERRERQEARPERVEERSTLEGTSHEHYDDEGTDDGRSTRDHQQSPHPDSDHKDTNSEPEDERDLRRQTEEADDFQRVERRGRKSKPSLEQTYRPPQGQQRGRGSTRGGPPPNRGNF